MKIPTFVTPKLITRKITKLSMVNPLPGSDIGIPLNIFQNIYTNLHYGFDITTPKSIALQFLIGYYTYGKDRYYDALEYEKNNFETNKQDLYNYINNNKYLIYSTLNISYLTVVGLLLYDENFIYNIPFILLLESTNYYKQIKEKIGILKPFYISILWTMCSVILPCVLHDNNYDILYYPLDYIPCMLTLFSLSNLVDSKDIVEDKENGIMTIPVTLGVYNSTMISLFALSLASLFFGLSEHYLDRPLINSLNEIQNAGLAYIAFNSTEN